MKKYIKAYAIAFLLSSVLLIVLISIFREWLGFYNQAFEYVVIGICSLSGFLLKDFRKLNLMANIIFVIAVAWFFYYRGTLLVAVLNGYSL